MNPIIEFMRGNYNKWNGESREIGWYMCIPMKVIAETFGMTLDQLGQQTWYWKGEEDKDLNCPHCGTYLIKSSLSGMDEFHCEFIDCGWAGSFEEIMRINKEREE